MEDEIIGLIISSKDERVTIALEAALAFYQGKIKQGNWRLLRLLGEEHQHLTAAPTQGQSARLYKEWSEKISLEKNRDGTPNIKKFGDDIWRSYPDNLKDKSDRKVFLTVQTSARFGNLAAKEIVSMMRYLKNNL